MKNIWLLEVLVIQNVEFQHAVPFGVKVLVQYRNGVLLFGFIIK